MAAKITATAMRGLFSDTFLKVSNRSSGRLTSPSVSENPVMASQN
jgi:hypothetical protein